MVWKAFVVMLNVRLKGGIHMRRIFFTGLVLILAYFSISWGYMKVWFAILWGIIAIIAVVNIEANSWWEPGRLKLHPTLQLILALILVMATIIATDWNSFTERDSTQAVYAFWTLFLYKEGFRWAYLHLRRKKE